MGNIRVSDINSEIVNKSFFPFPPTCFIVYKDKIFGKTLDLPEPAKKAYADYSNAKHQLKNFEKIDKDLEELSTLLFRLVNKKDLANAVNYDLNHPIWKAFQKLLEKNGEFTKAVSELKELLDPVINIHTGEVVKKEEEVERIPRLGGMKKA